MASRTGRTTSARYTTNTAMQIFRLLLSKLPVQALPKLMPVYQPRWTPYVPLTVPLPTSGL